MKTTSMIMETIENPVKKNVGRNIQKIRVYFGIKQDALARDLGMSQQSISKIEQQEEIEETLLLKISDVLGVSPEVIRNFDEEKAIYNINNNSFRDNTFEEGSSAIAQQFNPVEKIVELYERLLKSEREKNEILQNSKS
jgi:transcriptional regulator with XRE-family HTH domain